MNRYLKRTAAVLCACLTLCGCAEVPSDVAQEIEILDQVSKADSSAASDSTAVSDSGAETGTGSAIRKTGTVRELAAQAEQELAENHSRIVIESVRIPDADSMPVCDVKIGGAPFETFSEICAAVFPDENTQPDNPVYQMQRGSDPLDEALPAYDHPYWEGEHLRSPNVSFIDYITFYPRSDLPNYGLVMQSTGYLKGTQTGVTEYSGYTDYIPLSSDTPDIASQKKPPIHYTRAEAVEKNTVYPMAEGSEWALKDAVQYVEQIYNTTLSKSNAIPLHYSVKDVYVLTVSEQQFAYFFFVDCADSAGRLFDCSMKYSEKWLKNQIESGKPYPMENYSIAYCTGIEKLNWFEKNETFSEIMPTQENPELLSVTEAARVIDELLAPSQAIRIPCAELNYVLMCKGCPYLEKWGLEVDPQFQNSSFAYSYFPNYARTTCDFEIRPMWCLRTQDYSEFDLNVGYSYLVDAVTGKLWFTRVTNIMDDREEQNVKRIIDYINGEDIE